MKQAEFLSYKKFNINPYTNYPKPIQLTFQPKTENLIIHPDFEAFSAIIKTKDITIYMNDTSKIFAAQIDSAFNLSLYPKEKSGSQLQMLSIDFQSDENLCDKIFVSTYETEYFKTAIFDSPYILANNITYSDHMGHVCFAHATSGRQKYAFSHALSDSSKLTMCQEANTSCLTYGGSGSLSTNSNSTFIRVDPKQNDEDEGIVGRTFPDDDERFQRTYHFKQYRCELPITIQRPYCKAKLNENPSRDIPIYGDPDAEVEKRLIEGALIASIVIFVLLIIAITIVSVIIACCMNSKNEKKVPETELSSIQYSQPILINNQPQVQQPQPNTHVSYPIQTHPQMQQQCYPLTRDQQIQNYPNPYLNIPQQQAQQLPQQFYPNQPQYPTVIYPY